MELVAGPLRAGLGPGAQLRDLRVGDVMIVDAVSLTLRTPDWATLRPELVTSTTTPLADGTRVEQHWRVGDPGSEVDAALVVTLQPGRVVVESMITPAVDLELNRAGLVALLPLELADRPVRLTTADGDLPDRFPVPINPHPPFPDVLGLAFSPGPGVDVMIDFGTPYEIEDHRNWTDAGWKAYAPPLREPAPRRYGAEHPVRSAISIMVTTEGVPPPERTVVRVEVGGPSGRRLPRIGVGAGPGEIADDVLGAGSPFAFLHAELVDGLRTLDHAASQARRLGVPLHVTVPADRLDLADPIADRAVAVVLPIDPETHVSTPSAVSSWRTALAAAGVQVAAGTSGYVAEYGRAVADFDTGDLVQLSVSPEVHHTEAERVTDTLRALPYVVVAARSRAGGAAVHVAPITLAQRTSMHEPALGESAPWSARFAPDGRVNEAFGAAWTLGAVAGLDGADSLGFFSLADGHGLLLDSRPTPAASLLLGLAAHAGEDVLTCTVSDPRRVAALAVHRRRWLANLTAEMIMVRTVDGDVELGPYETFVAP